MALPPAQVNLPLCKHKAEQQGPAANLKTPLATLEKAHESISQQTKLTEKKSPSQLDSRANRVRHRRTAIQAMQRTAKQRQHESPSKWTMIRKAGPNTRDNQTSNELSTRTRTRDSLKIGKRIIRASKQTSQAGKTRQGKARTSSPLTA